MYLVATQLMNRAKHCFCTFHTIKIVLYCVNDINKNGRDLVEVELKNNFVVSKVRTWGSFLHLTAELKRTS